MASEAAGGADLACTDCHITQDHRIAGRGIDLRQTDLDVTVSCTNCHADNLHSDPVLNRHTDRLYCTTCHNPYFAKITSTDMLRDYRTTEVYEAKRLYEPTITRQAMVVPEYGFWNGYSYIYEFGTVAKPTSTGRILMGGPEGSIRDDNAKIYPLKHHVAIQAIDPVTRRLLPVHMGVLFQTGDVHDAILRGTAAVGWDLPNGYTFVETERYMGIFHEVSPASEALVCSDCHEGDRMDFTALGYKLKSSGNGKPLCASCHPDRSRAWPNDFFVKVHDKHIRDVGLSCQKCHTLSPRR